MDKELGDFIFAIVGVGQIGGSFALSLKKNKIGKKIIGVDRKEVITQPEIKEIVDFPTSNLNWAIEKADIILLSTPILTILKLLPVIADRMRKHAILLDTGSTKKEIFNLMRKFPERILIAGHPMAGTEKSGFKSANSELFKNKIFSLTFPTFKSLEGKEIIIKIIEKIGAYPFEIDAEGHDLFVSLTSHLPYVISIALSNLAFDLINKNSLFEKFISSGFLSASRLAMTNEEMGAGILKTNSLKIIKMIEELVQRLKEAEKIIKKGSLNEITLYLKKAKNFQFDLRKKNESYN